MDKPFFIGVAYSDRASRGFVIMNLPWKVEERVDRDDNETYYVIVNSKGDDVIEAFWVETLGRRPRFQSAEPCMPKELAEFIVEACNAYSAPI
jgi:hypothetical protein